LLKQYAIEHRAMPPGGFVRGLRQHLQTFTAGQPLSDDTTIVALRRAG